MTRITIRPIWLKPVEKASSGVCEEINHHVNKQSYLVFLFIIIHKFDAVLNVSRLYYCVPYMYHPITMSVTFAQKWH